MTGIVCVIVKMSGFMADILPSRLRPGSNANAGKPFTLL